MLVWITARGGERPGDVAEIVTSVADQAAAHGGEGPDHRQAWDGVDRLKASPGGSGTF